MCTWIIASVYLRPVLTAMPDMVQPLKAASHLTQYSQLACEMALEIQGV